MKEYKIAIIGNHNAILGFSSLGIDVFGLNDNNAKEQAVKILDSGNYAIVFITEDWAEKLEKVLDEYYSRALPAIVSVPSPKGSSGVALKNLKKIVEQAVGSDILK
ncbi:V-type ATP synthase subunit F [Candidatus Falkowbacteria bacterium RIFOXYB2_FULL_34_18]|uniref:V-type ATP synthase subunit F n=1 Tax=Candidatus Falkowbacteria bacterium RIFOXYD2_FULL_34_120 TaxID=1798007 RepID=A0A1F5TSI6_9BACT|nr:MAG: V-type ATP synthase subunit F [Candidatus Falkowbacteria bacterium RIFOXYB2_FULL_34_18]OGF30171.1 MAG: V-type ATP synthase subunit F [Candidatus Falkowbacteria bacterium RIFOXYC12_FULL_34_55]OGF37680.1 MAG: V-type ATP synthase subunit F [Candidatus Falkowbacteria bacterium RIFOXYC2_FULL_34_220]OGF39407.1 MAG: V-type ATP synthase subunit F [Candidatus Falkowbacteria bacterium RIFOXYD12_FULL_34_57]OGF41936.1 MAG: V-type ATP synthase subunit F [Candidatus Falkowbacteria bacterium RIFOXYD2_